MPSRLVFLASLLIAAIGIFLPRWLSQPPVHPPPVIGRNNTILFLTNVESGLSNVFLATAHALLERHPHTQLHYASFPDMSSKLNRISKHGRQQNPLAQDIQFHALPDLAMSRELVMAGKFIADTVHPHASAGISHMCKDLQLFVAPWPAEHHLVLYHELSRIISEVDPAIIALDTAFAPAIDATRDADRLHAFISPNTLVDNFIGQQPWAGMLWKYPVVGSGFPFPLPWSKIPENIYLSMRLIYAMVVMPDLAAKRQILKANGLRDPLKFYALHRPDVPWFSQNTPGASRPVDFVPRNVTSVGPMSISLGAVEAQDPALAEWLGRAPTVLVNLGSAYTYTEAMATAMAEGLARVLGERADLQVLWKFVPESDGVAKKYNVTVPSAPFGDDFKTPLRPFIDVGRVKLEKWFAADPLAIMETGHIIASVHHGGAGNYHEAIGAGVPQVVLPQWIDLYNYAQMAEDIGVGIWGCRESSPFWTAQCLADALLKVIDGGELSLAMQKNAKRLGEETRKSPGQYIVAKELASLAAKGR